MWSGMGQFMAHNKSWRKINVLIQRLAGILAFVMTCAVPALAQSPINCAPVEPYSDTTKFQNAATLGQLIANQAPPGTNLSLLSSLSTNNELIDHVRQSPDWLELGTLNNRRIIRLATTHISKGKIVVAGEIRPNLQSGRAALLTGQQIHGSSLWPAGVPAGVFYDSTDASRRFAGCKLSYVWRSPRNVRAFVYSPQYGQPGKKSPEFSTPPATRVDQIAQTESVPPKPSVSVLADPIYQADKILHDLKEKDSTEMRDFKFEGCVMLHGPKGWQTEWENFRESERVDLAKLFSDVPLTKLRTSGNASQDTQFMIGPLCDCPSYEKALESVAENNFELLGILQDENHSLEGCLSQRKFR